MSFKFVVSEENSEFLMRHFPFAGWKATVHFDKKDRYGREVGKILVNERDVNLEQITRGMAWVYRQYQRELSKEDRVLYDRAEGAAKLSRRGLWTDATPTPPWDFRRAKKLE